MCWVPWALVMLCVDHDVTTYTPTDYPLFFVQAVVLAGAVVAAMATWISVALPSGMPH